MLTKLAIMPESRKPFHRYPSNTFHEEEKYLPSFFIDFEHYRKIIRAEIRPNKQDRGYYQVTLNNVFLAHIHSISGVWMDFLGVTNEMYEIVGKLIERHE